jgi:hypothetical protein
MLPRLEEEERGCKFQQDADTKMSVLINLVYHYNGYLYYTYQFFDFDPYSHVALSVLDEVVGSGTSTSAPLSSLATHTPKSSSLLKVDLY